MTSSLVIRGCKGSLSSFCRDELISTMKEKFNGKNRILLHDVFEETNSYKSRVRVIDLPVVDNCYHLLKFMWEIRKDQLSIVHPQFFETKILFQINLNFFRENSLLNLPISC